MLSKTQAAKLKTEINSKRSPLPVVFQALGDYGRFRIFRLVSTGRDVCVTDIANIFGITVSAASQQLRVLERLGLVVRVRAGQTVCYKINGENRLAGRIIEFIKKSHF